MNSESTLSDALTEIDVALAASDNERAASLASELLLAYPNAVGVLRQRARALAASGRSLQAAEVHRRVLEILPADGDAMAGLARTLHAAGQTAEARDAAQMALDYQPGDESLRQFAASDGLPFQPDETSMQLRKALAQSHVGLLDHGIAGLHSVVRRAPDRADARIALMQALWRHGARIGAAEQAQALLDDYPNCLNAHLLLLEMWRRAGAGDMERVHQNAIQQVDPDHRVTRGMLGTQSPLQPLDVPARPALPLDPAIVDEDPLAREDWVDNLLAESRAAPKPLEQREPDNTPDSAPADSVAGDAAVRADEDDFVSSLLPLEWSAASDLSEAPAQDGFIVPWIDGNAKDDFSPARPRHAVPDPRDGVPEELPPLEWETASDDTGAPAQRITSAAVTPASAPAPEATRKPSPEKRVLDDKPLKPMAAAGVIAAAKALAPTQDDPSSDVSETFENSAAGPTTTSAAPPAKSLAAAGTATAAQSDADELRDAGHAGESPGETSAIASASPASSDYKPLKQGAPAAQAESIPQQTRAEQKAAQAMNAEVAAAAIKPMPIDAVERVDEDMNRWDDAGDASRAAPAASAPDTPPAQPASRMEAPAPGQQPVAPPAAEAAPAVVRVVVETENAAKPAAEAAPKPQAPAEEAERNQGSVMKAMAAAAMLGAVSKKRKKREAEEAAPATPGDASVPAAKPVATETSPSPASIDAAPTETAPVSAVLPAPPAATDTPATEAAPEANDKPAARPAKGKAARKPAAKAVKKDARESREAQTERIRKTYERAIATVKREELPKLIADLNKAAEADADNKLIHELLGQAYNRQGNIPAAINAYRKALDLAERA